jgi:hypothetical protein
MFCTWRATVYSLITRTSAIHGGTTAYATGIGPVTAALDWAAHIGEENGRELAESFLAAARKGDWRAAEALMSRIYGKPRRLSLPTARPRTRLAPTSGDDPEREQKPT